MSFLSFPMASVNDISYFQELHSRLKARGVLLCYSDFAAGKAQVEVHKKMPPNFVKLSRTLTRAVLQEASRQTQLETMVADCKPHRLRGDRARCRERPLGASYSAA